ncbi:MAG: hypothetical protein WDN50_09035 [Bradyrhizobium sp.]
MLIAPGKNSTASGGLGSYADADILSAGILAASEAKAVYRRFVDRRLVEYSSSEMALFDIQKDGDSYSISFAKPGGRQDRRSSSRNAALYASIRGDEGAWRKRSASRRPSHEPLY